MTNRSQTIDTTRYSYNNHNSRQYSNSSAPSHYSSSYASPVALHVPGTYFTQEQHAQILHMIKGKEVEYVVNIVKMHSGASTLGGASGTSGTVGITIALLSKLVESNWIVDTGASNHIIHNINLLKRLKEMHVQNKGISSRKVLGIGR
ncbi:hypothetical protein HAX54_011896 [Datura stramonium]|uniref:Uncharacterized protein n=1 Tax=Datura stramonium TaxID=4076 RepID=A0ABS8TIW2_DATST|nr:hypothetical protein [Datura stramonium]